MTKLRYIRDGDIVHDLENGYKRMFSSINDAKGFIREAVKQYGLDSVSKNPMNLLLMGEQHEPE